MNNIQIKPSFIKGFIVGLAITLALMAILPISFQPAAIGQGEDHKVAVNSGTYQISLRGVVPVICRVSVKQHEPLMGGRVTNLGTMSAFCNNASGYIVYVDSTSDLAGAVITVDDQKIPLSPSGSTAIVHSNLPAKRNYRVSLDMTHLPRSSGALWFRIVPL